MGGGHRPGTSRRRSGGEGSAADGIDQYGRGDYDPATGLYEWYEYPDDHPARKAEGQVSGEGGGVTWVDLTEQWGLIEADWASEYHRLLSDDYRSMTSRHFEALVRGLFAADTRVARHFAPKEDQRAR